METFGKFPRTFAKALFHNIWTYLAIASTCITFLPLPPGWRKVVPFGIALLFVISAYRAAWLLHQQNEREKRELLERVEELKKRPYNETHRKLVEDKVQRLTVTARDLLRYLLHHGQADSIVLSMACQKGESQFSQALGSLLYEEGLVSRTQEQNPDCASVQTLWRINSQFIEVLQDLLYPRNESDSESHFRL